MTTLYSESADKQVVTPVGEAAPYTTEESYAKLVPRLDTVEAKATDNATRIGNLEGGTTTWNTLVDAADDTAAATAGVSVGHLYRTGSIIKVRIA